MGGVNGVFTALACTRMCDDVSECVGFVFMNSTAHVTKCYHKSASCVETVPNGGATMFDSISKSKRI